MPNVTEWDEAKKVPDEIYHEMGERGYLAGMLGIHYPTKYTDKRVQSVLPEKWDHFHEMYVTSMYELHVRHILTPYTTLRIITDELSRTGSGGLVWNLIGGYGIGGPPLFKFGKKALVERIGPDVLTGRKRICLAITEPGR
jgi:alkylation response protein AidB-like acyl-CoA dehydrogenase